MTPCHVPDCTTTAGPSGFCARHQNRLNARSAGLAEHMTLADRIAIAGHPGWRGRKWRLDPRLWRDGLHFHVIPQVGLDIGYRTAAEALAELDRRNGLTPAADVAALRRRLADVEREAEDQRHRAEAAEDALTDLAAIARGKWADTGPADGPKPDTVGGRAYDAVCRLARDLAAAREALAEAERERTEARGALTDARLIAGGLMPPPPPSDEAPVTLGAATIATVAELWRDNERAQHQRDAIFARYRADADRDADTIAVLRADAARRADTITAGIASAVAGFIAGLLLWAALVRLGGWL